MCLLTLAAGVQSAFLLLCSHSISTLQVEDRQYGSPEKVRMGAQEEGKVRRLVLEGGQAEGRKAGWRVKGGGWRVEGGKFRRIVELI